MSRQIDHAVLLKGEATIEEIDPETEETISSETKENTVVDVAGAETITDYIAGNTPTDFAYMIIGDGSTTAPAETDTDLSTRLSTSPSLTPTQTGTPEKTVVWSHTFSSTTGNTSVEELGMFDGTATGAGMLNRLTFTAKDNANNDLKITYKLTVS